MKTPTIFALLLAAALLPAAAEDFPLCMYGIAGPEDLAVIKKAGFNCFQTYERGPEKLAALAAQAAALQLKMLAHPDKVIGSAYDAEAKGWPMLAWYLCDEPEVQKLTPAALAELDRRVKAWDPGHRTAFVMGKGIAAFTYGAAADALMVDWYPVAHLKLESVGYQVTLLKEAARKLDPKNPAKPVWAVLQAFDWLEYPQLRKPPVGRFPTYAEVRFMSYLSIARGAGGLFYFMYQCKDGPLSKLPERWALFEKIAAELNVLRPALGDAADTPPPPGLGAGLSATVLKNGSRTFMILLNPSALPVPVNLSVLKGWQPLFEGNRKLEDLLPGGKARYMPPYRVLVLEQSKT